jgi:hypothetical protein
MLPEQPRQMPRADTQAFSETLDTRVVERAIADQLCGPLHCRL